MYFTVIDAVAAAFQVDTVEHNSEYALGVKAEYLNTSRSPCLGSPAVGWN